MPTRTPRRRRVNHSRVERIRHSDDFNTWLDAQSTRLGSSADEIPVTPLVCCAQAILELTGNLTGAVKASGVLTLTGNAVPAAQAVGTLTLTGNAADTQTVVIDGKTYTFQDTLTNVDGHVLVGATASDSIDNLIAAITLAAGGSTTYAAATTEHPTVTAAPGAGDTMVVTAKDAGVAGNDIATTETITGSWGGATLSGGLDAETVTIGSKVYSLMAELEDVDGAVMIGATASDTIDNLVAAINLDAGSGTLYAGSMTANMDVVASAGAGDTLVVTARVDGEAANATVTTTTLSDGSWGAATLEDGVDGDTITLDDVVYKFQVELTDEPGNILLGATAADSLDNLALAITQMDDTGSGEVWAASTPAHPTMKTMPRDGDTLPIMVRQAGDLGNQKTGSVNAENATLSDFEGGNSSNLFTSTDHGLTSGEGPFGVNSEGTLAQPLSEGSAYYVYVEDDNLIGLATSRDAAMAGNLVYTTDPGMGDHTITKGTTKEAIFELLRTYKPKEIVAATDIDALD